MPEEIDSKIAESFKEIFSYCKETQVCSLSISQEGDEEKNMLVAELMSKMVNFLPCGPTYKLKILLNKEGQVVKVERIKDINLSSV